MSTVMYGKEGQHTEPAYRFESYISVSLEKTYELEVVASLPRMVQGTVKYMTSNRHIQQWGRVGDMEIVGRTSGEDCWE